MRGIIHPRSQVTSVRRPSHAISTAIVFLFLLGIYLDIGAEISEGVRVPSILALAVLPLMLPLARVRKRDLWLILTVAFLAVITILFAPGAAVVERRVLAILQLMVAMLGAIAGARLLARMHEGVVERMLLCLWSGVLLLAAIEGLGIGSAVFDQFHEFAFGGIAGLEDSYQRDLELVGRSRPRVFTAEPSYAYLGFIVFSTAWLLVRTSWSRALILLGSNIVMLILMGSPLFLLAVLAILLIAVANSERKVVGHSIALLAVAATIGAAYLFGGDILDAVIERLDVSDLEAYSSAHVRIVYPVLALIDVSTISPVVGLGLGGEVNLEQYSRFSLSYLEAAGTNAFVLLFILLGPVGGTILMGVLLQYWRREWTNRVLLALFLFLFVAAQMGGSVTLRFWGYVFVLIGALAIADRARSRRPTAMGVRSERGSAGRANA